MQSTRPQVAIEARLALRYGQDGIARAFAETLRRVGEAEGVETVGERLIGRSRRAKERDAAAFSDAELIVDIGRGCSEGSVCGGGRVGVRPGRITREAVAVGVGG